MSVAGGRWPGIAARWRIILFGLWPQWRSALACLAVGAMIVLPCMLRFWTGRRLASVRSIGTVACHVLMKGPAAALSRIGEEK